MPNSIVTRKLAEENAKKYLRKVSDAAITGLQKSLENGTFDGNKYRTCFFGNLATGSGYNFLNKVRPQRTLGQFLRNLGLCRTAGEFEPIEFYCRDIRRGSTILDDERARDIHSWCDDVLNERNQPVAEPETEIDDTFDLTEYRTRRRAAFAGA
jgi:hypothetical protein